MKTDCKTGVRIPYPSMKNVELVEWKCHECLHRWFECSDENEYPEQCPLCGVLLDEND